MGKAYSYIGRSFSSINRGINIIENASHTAFFESRHRNLSFQDHLLGRNYRRKESSIGIRSNRCKPRPGPGVRQGTVDLNSTSGWIATLPLPRRDRSADHLQPCSAAHPREWLPRSRPPRNRWQRKHLRSELRQSGSQRNSRLQGCPGQPGCGPDCLSHRSSSGRRGKHLCSRLPCECREGDARRRRLHNRSHLRQRQPANCPEPTFRAFGSQCRRCNCPRLPSVAECSVDSFIGRSRRGYATPQIACAQ